MKRHVLGFALTVLALAASSLGATASTNGMTPQPCCSGHCVMPHACSSGVCPI